MNIRKKLTVIAILLAVILVVAPAVFAFTHKKTRGFANSKNDQRTTTTHNSGTIEQTYQKCIDTAEENYKDYVRANGYSSSDDYGEKFYSLTDEEESHVNATRAKAYNLCFEMYGS